MTVALRNRSKCKQRKVIIELRVRTAYEYVMRDVTERVGSRAADLTSVIA